MATNVTLLVILTIFGSFEITQGLQCYVCNYANVWGSESGEPSCKPGGSPDAKLLMDCNSTNSVVHYSSHKKVTVADLIASEKLDPNQGIIYGCGRIGVEAEFSGGSLTDVTRGCVAVSTGLEDTCKTATKEEWAQDGGNDEWTQTVIGYVSVFPENAVVAACFCNSDKCNVDQ